MKVEMDPESDRLMGNSLQNAARSGSRTGAVSGILQQGLGVVTTGVLARLLTPDDFGLIAVATIVVGLFQVASRIGLAPSLQRMEQIDDRVVSTFFWSMLGVGIGAALTAGFASSFLADILGDERAGPLIAVLSVGLIFAFASSIPASLLKRRFRFGFVYAADVIGVVLYAMVALALASLTNLGVWAIVWARVLSQLGRFLFLMGWAQLRPRLEFDRTSLRKEVGFGAGVLGATLTMWIVKNGDYWMVSKVYSTSTLGIYYVAYILPNLLRQRMTWVATDILLPLLSSIRTDRDRLTSAYLRMLRQVAFIGFPLLIGLALVSSEVISIFVGAQWGRAAAPASILAVAAAFELLNPLATQLFFADGESGRGFLVSAIRLPVLGVGLVLAASIGGLSAVACAVLTTTIAATLYAQFLVTRSLEVSPKRIVGALSPIVAPVLSMAVAVTATRGLLGEIGVPLSLIVLVAVGIFAYGVTGLVAHRRTFGHLIEDSLRIVWPKARLHALTRS